MRILLAEPFFAGSQRQWAEGYRRHSRPQAALLTLPGRHWKWRMFGGAVSLARRALESPFHPDLVLASDMLGLAAFLALTRWRFSSFPAALYFHENQITYPWLPDRLSDPGHLPADRREHHLYRTEAGFHDGLKRLILNIGEVRSADYQYFVAPYDWSILAPRYDAFFENLLA